MPLSVDGTGQSGPQLVAQMREPAGAGAKAQHMRAEVEHDIELRRSKGRSLVWLFRWSLTVLCKKWWSGFQLYRNAIPRRCVTFARDQLTSKRTHCQHYLVCKLQNEYKFFSIVYDWKICLIRFKVSMGNTKDPQIQKET